jgi:hypothetical protein
VRCEALNAEGTRPEAAEHIRGLIEEIRLVPEKDRLRIELFDQLSALFNLANQLPRSGGTKEPVTLVAGARNSHHHRLPPLVFTLGLETSQKRNSRGF